MSTIRTEVLFTVIDPTVAQLWLTLSYRTSEPLEVVANFGRRCDGRRIVWRLARDILRDGLLGPAGVGDFCCWTDAEDRYHLALSSPDGRAILRCPADNIRALLIDAEDLVPYGAEVIDFDAELRHLLMTGGGQR
ncbi:SsgA family sporulation/cell division regulator [Dactylosporangium roseum]|uniref:SsgA family sporulation/cell division regulator n=1 Tax=Dactylosporangium roseum TaxID=47989 RepID=A0ABY5Z6A7_9ACTN|nr:SsgA family sporulation/cell division regulator [Dactylosporangium roseum]UWZ37556.1 SsgA family sporulation/cell division regulator [Dactylosporangium roseum]